MCVLCCAPMLSAAAVLGGLSQSRQLSTPVKSVLPPVRSTHETPPHLVSLEREEKKISSPSLLGQIIRLTFTSLSHHSELVPSSSLQYTKPSFFFPIFPTVTMGFTDLVSAAGLTSKSYNSVHAHG